METNSENIMITGLVLSFIIVPILFIAGILTAIISKKYRKHGLLSIIISLILLTIGVNSILSGCGISTF